MSKRVKALIARELTEGFQGLDKCVIMGLIGVPAVRADRVRAALKTKNMCLQVVKNRLASVAFEEAGMREVAGYLDGPSAIMTGGSDTVELVKAAAELARGEEGFQVRGGFGEGRALSSREVERLSKIPGRNDLYASLACGMAGTMRNFAGVLGAVLRDFVYGLKQLAGGKEPGA